MTRHGPERESLREHAIIARYFAPLARAEEGALGLLDDTACLTPSEEEDWLVTTDMLVAGVHFFPDDAPGDIAHKLLAVNVSDIVAKGGEASRYTLSLALPATMDSAWLADFAQGLGSAQNRFGCVLVGGDTVATPGPLTLSLTLLGRLPRGSMVQRTGAQEGDRVYMTGSVGDAALGLKLRQNPTLGARWELTEDQRKAFLSAYLRPMPPTALAPILRAHATAAMDVSDGLMGDFRKLCQASGLGGEIETRRLPLSQGAQQALSQDPELWAAVLTGGDDYQVLATIPPERATDFEEACHDAGVSVATIGRMVAQDKGVYACDEQGRKVHLPRESYEHGWKAS